MEEFQIWQIWSSNRIGSGLVGIGSILAVWLSMRIALNTRNNPETNILAAGSPDGSCSVVYNVESSEFNIKRVEVGDVEVAELGELNVGGIVKKNFVDACSFA